MATSKPEALDPRPRFPALRWREPAWLWLAVALALSVGWPVVALDAGFGLTLTIGFAVAFATGAALGTARAFQAAGRPPRARRDVVFMVLVYGALTAMVAPVLAASFSGAIGTQGYSWSMATAMWPLAIMLGAPVALFAGLAVSLVMFTKPPPREPDLEAVALARATDDYDDDDI
jgi:MFS family permease